MAVVTIQQINFQVFKLHLRQPLVTSSQTWSDRLGIIIQIIDITGRFGLGEATPLPNYEPLMVTARALKKVRQLLYGRQFDSLREISDLVNSLSLPAAARHGIELSLLNLLAAHHQVKLAQLLHGDHYRSAIAVNGLIGQVAPPQAVQMAASLVNQGYGCVKLKVGDAQDLARVQAVRDHFPNLIIRLDANQAWTTTEAIAKLEILQSLDIEYIEQPVSTIPDLALVKNQANVAIAADESIRTLAELQILTAHAAAQIVVLKPMIWGGILPTLAAANLAIAAGLEVVITHTLDGAIARLGALHLAAMPEITRPCGLDANSLFTTQDQLTQQNSTHDGVIKI